MTADGRSDGPRLACCQCAVDDLDVGSNLDRVVDRVRDLPPDVVVALFPELVLTGFVDDERVRSAAIACDGSEFDRVRAVAAETGTAVLVGFAEVAGDRWFNASAYVTPDGETTSYRKRHLWGAERTWFEPGDRRVVVDTPVGRTGLVTCYDLNDVADSAAFTDDRVDALFVTGAWPAEHVANWRLLCRARALDGARWLVACGRTDERSPGSAAAGDANSARQSEPAGGSDRGTVAYAGNSLVVRANGRVAAELDRAEEDLVVALDPHRFASDRREVALFDAD